MILRSFVAIVFINAFTFIKSNAQSIEPAAVNASGGFTSTSTHSFEYNVGQLIPSSVQAPLTPGVHQPAWSVGVAESRVADPKITVFPSPMASILYLQTDWNAGESLQYSLFDALGKRILKQNIHLTTGKERQEIPVGALAAGNYILEVIRGSDAAVATRFKLQKLR